MLNRVGRKLRNGSRPVKSGGEGASGERGTWAGHTGSRVGLVGTKVDWKLYPRHADPKWRGAVVHCFLTVRTGNKVYKMVLN